MSSGYGENSKPSANSDAYRNNPIWGKQKPPVLVGKDKLISELEHQLGVYKQLLEAAMESLPADSITHAAIEVALGEK